MRTRLLALLLLRVILGMPAAHAADVLVLDQQAVATEHLYRIDSRTDACTLVGSSPPLLAWDIQPGPEGRLYFAGGGGSIGMHTSLPDLSDVHGDLLSESKVAAARCLPSV